MFQRYLHFIKAIMHIGLHIFKYFILIPACQEVSTLFVGNERFADIS